MNRWLVGIALLFAIGVAAVNYTQMNTVHLWNSLIDNTVIGATTPAAATFTTSTATTSTATTSTATNLTVSSQETLSALTASASQLGLDGSKHVVTVTTFKGINYVIDGGGAAITTGSKGYVFVPFACTFTQWNLLADQSGSIQVDIKTSTFSGFPSTSSITGGNYPTISSSTKAQGIPTSWNTSLPVNEVIEFSVNSATTVQRVTVELTCSVS